MRTATSDLLHVRCCPSSMPQALRNAARDGAASVPLLRQLWAQLGTPTADEALNTMLAAMLSNSWAAVQAVQALWVPVKHGDWSKMVVTFPGG